MAGTFELKKVVIDWDKEKKARLTVLLTRGRKMVVTSKTATFDFRVDSKIEPYFRMDRGIPPALKEIEPPTVTVEYEAPQATINVPKRRYRKRRSK